MKLEKGQQVLKSRDDHAVVVLDRSGPPEEPTFSLPTNQTCSWAKPDDVIVPRTLRSRVEPWLTALFQSEHLSLLVGSGLTHAVHGIAVSQPLPGMANPQFGVFDDVITHEANRMAAVTGRKSGNFEDRVRVASELLRGLMVISPPEIVFDDCLHSQAAALREGLRTVIREFTDAILHGERSLASADSHKREEAFNYLVGFLMSFASRASARERLHIFTTNYDRYIEAGSDLAGLRLIDRFVGTLTPIFRASRLDVDLHYNPPGMRGEPRYLEGVARFTKLHGSIDWIDREHSISRIGLPFGAEDVAPHLVHPYASDTEVSQLMIYPNSAKDRETSYYPYVELFRDFAASICRPNSTLICYGYGFGDDHINRVVEDMLTIPSTHLVIISYGDPLGRIMDTYEKRGRHDQCTLLVGDHLGDLGALVDYYLPKSAIDRTTVRMAELLRARWEMEPSGRGGGDEQEGSESRS